MINTQNTIFESLTDKLKVGYALKLVAKSNEFFCKISGIMPIDKYVRLFRFNSSGARVYYFDTNDTQEYSLTNNTNSFVQSDNDELYLYTLGVINGLALQVFNPQSSPLLGTEYASEAHITYDKSPLENPNPAYQFKSFRRENFIVSPKIIVTNQKNTILNNPYIRIYGVLFKLTFIEKLPETYTTIALYDKAR